MISRSHVPEGSDLRHPISVGASVLVCQSGRRAHLARLCGISIPRLFATGGCWQRGRVRIRQDSSWARLRSLAKMLPQPHGSASTRPPFPLDRELTPGAASPAGGTDSPTHRADGPCWLSPGPIALTMTGGQPALDSCIDVSTTSEHPVTSTTTRRGSLRPALIHSGSGGG